MLILLGVPMPGSDCKP